MQTLAQRQNNKLVRYLEKLAPEARFIGIVGRGFERSVYKVFTQSQEGGSWWCFDSIAGPSKLGVEQILQTYKVLKIVRGSLDTLADLEHDASKPALDALFKTAAAFCGLERVRRTF